MVMDANSSDEEVLLKQCDEVTKTWKAFTKKSSNQHLMSLGLAYPDGSTLPTINTLRQVVNALLDKKDVKDQTTWGKVKGNMRAFVNTMSVHGYLFSIFPSGSIYTSVLSGVVSSFAMVSIFFDPT